MSNKINELHVNLLGKVLFATCAAWIIGKKVNTKIRGTEAEIKAVTDAMISSKRFQDELKRQGATVATVMDKLGLKHASAKEFERILGIPWPL